MLYCCAGVFSPSYLISTSRPYFLWSIGFVVFLSLIVTLLVAFKSVTRLKTDCPKRCTTTGVHDSESLSLNPLARSSDVGFFFFFGASSCRRRSITFAANCCRPRTPYFSASLRHGSFLVFDSSKSPFLMSNDCAIFSMVIILPVLGVLIRKP